MEGEGEGGGGLKSPDYSVYTGYYEFGKLHTVIKATIHAILNQIDPNRYPKLLIIPFRPVPLRTIGIMHTSSQR